MARPARVISAPTDQNVPEGLPRTVTIENESIPVTYEEIPLDQVRLDPENPRIREHLKQLGKTGKVTQAELQKIILEISGVPALLRSIRENRGLHDPIYVRHDGRVAEGNCRTSIFLFLRQAPNSDRCWQKIKALRLPPTVTERQIAVLQGHMHVAGKITWRAHEQSGHLHHMHKTLGMTPGEIATAIGLSEPKVKRLLLTYDTMTTHVIPKGAGDSRKKFSYVLEFYTNKKLEEFRAKPDNVKLFASLIVGKDPKLKRGAEVRDLHKIIGNAKAEAALKKEGFGKAISIVGKSDPTADSTVFRKLKELTAFVHKHMRTPEIERLRSGKREQQIVQDLFGALKTAAETAGLKLR